MRGRAFLGAGLAAVLVLAGGITLLVAGGGKSADDGGTLRWAKQPVVFQAPNLPDDRIATGTLKNESLESMKLEAMRDFKVVDAQGRELVTATVFSQTYGHGLFSPSRVPYARLPEAEKLRIGHAGELRPGKEIPVTISWREERGKPRAAQIRYPGGSLPIGRIQGL